VDEVAPLLFALAERNLLDVRFAPEAKCDSEATSAAGPNRTSGVSNMHVLGR
jgi:hypothetical protein